MFTKRISVLIASELADVPELQNMSNTGKVTITKALHLSVETRHAMQAHFETIGINSYHYHHNSTEQSIFIFGCSPYGTCLTKVSLLLPHQAYNKLVSLGLHIPDVIEQNIQSKISIPTSSKKEITS